MSKKYISIVFNPIMVKSGDFQCDNCKKIITYENWFSDQGTIYRNGYKCEDCKKHFAMIRKYIAT